MTYALGIDVSKWQDDNSTPQKMDFAKARAAGAEFVSIKASQACWADEDFLYNWKDAKEHGLLRMAFHFMDWTRPAEAQADFFSGLLEKDPGEIPPCLDYECRTNIPSPGTARLECKAFLERLTLNLRGLPGFPIIYTGNDYWHNYGSEDVYWTRYPLWIAYPAAKPIWPKPWSNWLFWQYSWVGDGRKYGAESVGMDMDYFNGDVDKLRATFGGAPPAPSADPVYPSPEWGAWATKLLKTLEVK